MKISLNWLKEYIDLPQSADQIADKLTFSGLEVEGVELHEGLPGGLDGIVIGEVIECEQHPDADKLKVTKVNIGAAEPVQIVCGAANVATGQKVVVATVNATLYPKDGEPFKIKKAKLRGQLSEGMICAEDEIGLGSSHDGIMVLDTDLPNGTPAADYFKIENDTIFEIGLTPNRADAASHMGVARDLKALYAREIKLTSVENFKIDNNQLPFQITVEDQAACPRYSGIAITNVQVSESPDWLKGRLNAIGIDPINNVVDITNFILHDLGQPLHAFDADKIQGDHVRVKCLPEGTPFVTLDGKERKLSATDLMICDGDSNPLCIAGVFGGMSSGVSLQTKNIFLESAYFSADSVRKTAQHHGLKTDASFRYERGTDPNITVYALKKAALLIKELAGGQLASDIVDVYPQPIAHFEVLVKYKNIDRLIGKKISQQEVKSILNHLEIELVNETADGFTAIVPPYRVDVNREADIIEEILRIHGINNIEIGGQLGADFLAEFPAKDVEKYQLAISNMLADSGFFEMVTNSLTKPQFVKSLNGFAEEENVVILNKLSEELEVMRQSLVFTALDSISHNINHKQSNLKFFEFGKEYKKVKGKYKESVKLAVYMTGNKQATNWATKEEAVNFSDLYAIVQKILHKLKTEIGLKEVFHDDLFDYGLHFVQKERILCQMGKLNKKLLKSEGIKQEVFCALFDWEKLLQSAGSQVRYQPVSKFPEVKRDLSLVLDKKVSFDQVKDLAVKNAGSLLQDILLFDIYQGDKIASNQKAYAMTFVLQDKEKTLTDKVIDKTMGRLMQVFENELNAIIRK